MIYAKNYEKLSKFIKIYGQNTVGPFFGHGVVILFIIFIDTVVLVIYLYELHNLLRFFT